MPGHVMSTPRPGRSSPSVCFGSCFVSWGEPTKGSAPHGAGKGMRRGEPMTEVTAHTSAGQLGWKKAQVSTGGRGGGARCTKDHESIGSPGSPASRCQCIGLVVPSSPCSLYITSPAGGAPEGLYGQVRLSEGAPCMPPVEILCHREPGKGSEKSRSKERGELYFDLPFSKPFWWQKSSSL